MAKSISPINSIWMITREYGELAGAGGVKDVAMQLSVALSRSGRAVSVVLPLYGTMDPEHLGFSRFGLAFDLDMSYPHEERREFVSVWHRKDEVDLYLLDSPRFREKTGVYTYTAQDERQNAFHRQGEGHFDYFAMNVLHQKAALCLMVQLGAHPDIIHCHDAHTALLPAMVREQDGFRHYFKETGFVVTIHNAGRGYHQEVHDLPFAQAITDLPARVIHENLLDGAFDPFLAAAHYAEMNTVSENYARELRESADDAMTGWLGHQLLDRGLALQGITNGIDPAEFNPLDYKRLGLPAGFQPGEAEMGDAGESFAGSSGKAQCRKDLCAAIASQSLSGIRQSGSLDFRPDQPLVTFIGRFSTQKGVDIMIDALRYLLTSDHDFQVLLLGSGQKEIEETLVGLARDHRYHGRVCLLRGFDSRLANWVYAAGDFFLVPSRYEPCGLTDFIAQLFGNLPIVHHVGGLVKVVDGETGFTFHQHSGIALLEAMLKAFAVYRSSRGEVAAMQRKAVALIQDQYTWDTVKERYLDLYHAARGRNSRKEHT